MQHVVYKHIRMTYRAKKLQISNCKLQIRLSLALEIMMLPTIFILYKTCATIPKASRDHPEGWQETKYSHMPVPLARGSSPDIYDIRHVLLIKIFYNQQSYEHRRYRDPRHAIRSLVRRVAVPPINLGTSNWTP